MAAVINNPPRAWSTCSIAAVQRAFSRGQNNLARCLHNQPSSRLGDIRCGDGLVEGDEVCDCGTPQVSDDSGMVGLYIYTY